MSFREGKGWVIYDPSQVTVEAMAQAIARAGYRASVAEGPVPVQQGKVLEGGSATESSELGGESGSGQ